MTAPVNTGEAQHTHAVGRRGEEDAVRWLVAQGYEVLARNVVTVAGELDVVALDGETLCFIEVKSRRTRNFGPATEAVGRSKQRRIGRAATLYLARRPTNRECRFDVLGLEREKELWKFELVRDAFSLG